MQNDGFDSEDDSLRAALAPVSEMPGGLEARVQARLRAHRRRRLLGILVPAALAAGAIAAALLLRPSIPPTAPAGPLRFDPVTRRLSLPDGTSFLLGAGADAEFREVAGTRGLVRLLSGDVYCEAAPASSDLVIEAPGIRARTRGGRFVATTQPQEADRMNLTSAAAAGLLYVFSGTVAVDEGPKPTEVSHGAAQAPALIDSPNARIERRGRSLFLDDIPILAQVFSKPEPGASRLRGVVVTTSGGPVANAEVDVSENGMSLTTVRSDAAGSFVAEGLGEGDVTIVARADGYLEATTTATVAQSGEVDIAPMLLREARLLRGRVVDRWGAPVPGAAIKVTERRNVEAQVDRASLDLALKVEGTDVHVARVVERAALASVFAESRNAVRLSIEPKIEVTLASGELAENAFRWERAAVAFSGANRLVVSDGSSWPGVQSGEDGRFEVGGLWDGVYAAQASLTDWIDVSGPVEARAGADDVTLVLTRGGEIRGTVYGPDGAPLSGARVNDVVTDDDGRYRIGGLATGTVNLFAGPAELRQVVLSPRNVWLGGAARHRETPLVQSVIEFTGASSSRMTLRANRLAFRSGTHEAAAPPGIASRRDVAVREGEVLDGFDFQLPLARTIEGIVVDDLGLPLAGASVTFRASEETPHFESERSASTDEAGAFRLTEVFDVPGAVDASADGHLASTSGDLLGALRLVLPRAAALHGRLSLAGSLVLRDLAAPEANAQIFPIAPESNESSEFLLPGLHPGRYEAAFVIDDDTRLVLGTIDLLPGETTELGEIR